MNLTLNNLEVKECTKEDWNDVLSLLHETKLNIWLTGNENPSDFYTVKDKDTNQIICCFTFSQENNIGILKNFGVSKIFQGKGLGTYIANNIVPEIAKKSGIKRICLMGNNKGPYTSLYFWKKTLFKHIPLKQIEDKYFKDYIEYLISNYSDDVLYKEAAFYLDL